MRITPLAITLSARQRRRRGRKGSPSRPPARGDHVNQEVTYFWSPEPPPGAHGVGDPGPKANRRAAEDVPAETSDDGDEDEEVVDCERCGESVPADTDSMLHCAEGWEPSQGPVCPTCLALPDADTCLKCGGGTRWTGVDPPYTEDNSPGSVCPSCLEEVIGKD